jgi:hypothetical protein
MEVQFGDAGVGENASFYSGVRLQCRFVHGMFAPAEILNAWVFELHKSSSLDAKEDDGDYILMPFVIRATKRTFC